MATYAQQLSMTKTAFPVRKLKKAIRRCSLPFPEANCAIVTSPDDELQKLSELPGVDLSIIDEEVVSVSPLNSARTHLADARRSLALPDRSFGNSSSFTTLPELSEAVDVCVGEALPTGLCGHSAPLTCRFSFPGETSCCQEVTPCGLLVYGYLDGTLIAHAETKSFTLQIPQNREVVHPTCITVLNGHIVVGTSTGSLLFYEAYEGTVRLAHTISDFPSGFVDITSVSEDRSALVIVDDACRVFFMEGIDVTHDDVSLTAAIQKLQRHDVRYAAQVEARLTGGGLSPRCLSASTTLTSCGDIINFVGRLQRVALPPGFQARRVVFTQKELQFFVLGHRHVALFSSTGAVYSPSISAGRSPRPTVQLEHRYRVPSPIKDAAWCNESMMLIVACDEIITLSARSRGVKVAEGLRGDCVTVADNVGLFFLSGRSMQIVDSSDLSIQDEKEAFDDCLVVGNGLVVNNGSHILNWVN